MPSLKTLFSALVAPPGHVIFLTFFPAREEVNRYEILNCWDYAGLYFFGIRGLR
jgi:hypothetical protein